MAAEASTISMSSSAARRAVAAAAAASASFCALIFRGLVRVALTGLLGRAGVATSAWAAFCWALASLICLSMAVIFSRSMLNRRAFSRSFSRSFSSFSICSATRLASLASFSFSLDSLSFSFASFFSRSTEALVLRPVFRTGLVAIGGVAIRWGSSGYSGSLALTDLSESVDGPACMPSLAVDGDMRLAFPSALRAALLASKPLEVFRMDESLFFTCLRGLSRRLREGDFGGLSSTPSSATGFRVGFETEIVFLGVAELSMVGKEGTDADLEWPWALVVRSGTAGTFLGDVGLLLGSTNADPPIVSVPCRPSITSVE